jgi:hypothetical protein
MLTDQDDSLTDYRTDLHARCTWRPRRRFRECEWMPSGYCRNCARPIPNYADYADQTGHTA